MMVASLPEWYAVADMPYDKMRVRIVSRLVQPLVASTAAATTLEPLDPPRYSSASCVSS